MSSDADNVDPSRVQQLVAAGLEHHRAGRLEQAEAMYRQALQQQPDQPDALGLLGVIALQAGRPDAAVELLRRAAQIAPNFAVFNNLGEALRHAGRLKEAIDAYNRSIALNPHHPDAYSNLALAASRIGNIDAAVSALERLVKFLPERADFHDRLGSALLQQGDTIGAIGAFRKAISLAPNFAQPRGNLAVALTKKKPPSKADLDEALGEARRAVELSPRAAEAHGSLAVVLDKLGDVKQALAEFDRAAELNPTNADFYGMRGMILQNQDRIDEAIAVFQEGAKRCPTDARIFSNLSGLYRRQRKYKESVETAETAVKLAPGYSDAHGNLSLALLAAGDYEHGFAEYEWRWRCDNFTTAPREFPRPMWDGSSDLKGRTILVHTEQGYGDTLQFVRYVPRLADAGARVILECHHSLTKLLSRVRGVDRVIASGLALPDFDLHAPMLSMPRAFKTTLDRVPAEVPYLAAAPERVDDWNRRIASPSPGTPDFGELPSGLSLRVEDSRAGEGRGEGLAVGVIWAGNAQPDPKRNVPGPMLSVLSGISGVRFFSLQRTDAGTYTPPPPELKLIDLSPHLSDFHETAAAMTALDLILTIDTATAHLAGALGRPTWTLIPFAPDWRWLLDREDSPWYPTMRLFRQTKLNEWGDVLERVREEMTKLASR